MKQTHVVTWQRRLGPRVRFWLDSNDHDLRYNVSLSDFSDAEISRCANCLT
jgi:hypothetical protein